MPEFIVNGRIARSTKTPRGVLDRVVVDINNQYVDFESSDQSAVLRALLASFAELYGATMAAREQDLHWDMSDDDRNDFLGRSLMYQWPAPEFEIEYEDSAQGALSFVVTDAWMRRTYAALNKYPWPGLYDVEAAEAACDEAVRNAKAAYKRERAAAERAYYSISYQKYCRAVGAAENCQRETIREAEAELRSCKSFRENQRKEREDLLGLATIGHDWERPNPKGLRELYFLLTGREVLQ